MNEESLPNLMQSSFSETQDWSLTCKNLYQVVQDEIFFDEFSSITSNFGSIFIYELMRKKLDINDFQDALDTLLKTLRTNKKIEDVFYRFLNSETTLPLKEYLEHDRFDNSFSVYANMGLFFLTLKENQVTLEPSTLPYLKTIFASINANTIGALNMAGLNTFLYQTVEVLEGLVPLMKVAVSNPAYKVSKTGEFDTFFNNILQQVADRSYKKSAFDNQKDFDILNSNIPDFSNVYENLLVTDTPIVKSSKVLTVNPSVLNFLISNQIDVCAIIHQKYLKKYQEICDDEKFNLDETDLSLSSSQSKIVASWLKQDRINELAHDISYAMNTMQPSDFDLNINTQAPLSKNYVMLKFLEIKLKSGGLVTVSDQIASYIRDETAPGQESNYSSLKINFDLIKKYLAYQSLDVILPTNTSSARKVKL